MGKDTNIGSSPSPTCWDRSGLIQRFIPGWIYASAWRQDIRANARAKQTRLMIWLFRQLPLMVGGLFAAKRWSTSIKSERCAFLYLLLLTRVQEAMHSSSIRDWLPEQCRDIDGAVDGTWLVLSNPARLAWLVRSKIRSPHGTFVPSAASAPSRS